MYLEDSGFKYNLLGFLEEKTAVSRSFTCFRHALCALHARVEHLFGRNKEDVIGCLLAVHNLQLLHQEVDTAVCVLLPYLKGDVSFSHS